jgi:hypothetical protein
VVVVVVYEAGNGYLQITRDFTMDLVHLVLDTLVVPLQLPVGFWMVRRCQDVKDLFSAILRAGLSVSYLFKFPKQPQSPGVSGGSKQRLSGL